VRNRVDQLGKNVLRDAFLRFGTVTIEEEVPVSDTQKIDLWYVPNREKRRFHAAMIPDLWRAMSAEPAMIEPFSTTLSEQEFHALLRKRSQWHHVLHQQYKRKQSLPTLCMISAGRPEGVLLDYGFEASPVGPQGHYVLPAPGWRIHVLVVSELPRTRETVLLRLLGPVRTRIEAIIDVIRLPANAWEKTLALPWLLRLDFEVPVEPGELSEEQRGLIMEIQKWFEQYKRQLQEEGRKLGRDEGRKLGRDEGLDAGRLDALARLFEKRLGRPLREAERTVVAERLKRLGEDRLDEVVLDFGAEALANWLSDPAAN
jgi:hypothetical protein